MKRLQLLMAMLLMLMTSAWAQTSQRSVHKVQGIERADLNVPQVMNRASANGTGIDLDSIQYWVGEGDFRAAMAVKWHDGNGYTNVYVWGYRFDGTKTGADMIAAISATDPRFYTLIYGGTTIWDTELQDSVFAGNVIGGIGYNPSITYSTQQNIRVVYDGTTPYPLTYGAYDCQNYSFDNWTTTPTGGFWSSGWYTNGYWSYWNADGVDSDFEYASMGCSSRILDDEYVDGWSFAYDMTWYPTMDGEIVYVTPPTQSNVSGQINRPNLIARRTPSEGTKHTVTTVQEMADAIEAAVSGDIIEFDENLKGQVLECPSDLKITIRNKELNIWGNGVVISNGTGISFTADAKGHIKDFVFDGNTSKLISVYEVADESGEYHFADIKVENCTFRNMANIAAPAISCNNTRVLPKQYDIIIKDCLFENSKIKNANEVYKEGMIGVSGYKLHDHDFKVTLINNTFRGIKASKNSCLKVGNKLDIILINNVFEEVQNTKSGDDINIGADVYLTSAYNVISGTINDVYQSKLSETDKWAVDLETSLEDVDGQWQVKKDSPAYHNLPAGTVIEGVEFPTTDIYGNAIDYTKPTQSGCSQLVVGGDEEEPQEADYTQGTFLLNEDWYGHQNSTINFLTQEGEMVYRVIQKENEGVQLGCTAQYGTIYGGKMYITSKQEKDPGAKVMGGRLTIADARTMKVEKQFQTISANGYKGKADGRAFVGVNEHKGYMGTSNGIFILDLDTQEFTDFIKVPNDDEDLYTGQVGNMVRAGDYVFANHQNAGLLVIDPETDQITTILKPNDALVSTMTLANDGNLWLMSGGKLVKLDPNTLEYASIDVPEGVGLTSESWGAWRASTFCASHQENVLYWATGEGWGDICPSVRKYDIDKNEFSTFIDFSDEEWSIYGSGFRIDPVTDEAIMCLFKTYGDPTYITRKYNAAGEKIFELAMEKNYWFPALPIYPDNALPVCTPLEKQTLSDADTREISLANLATDADNMTAAIVKTVKAVSDETIVSAYITHGNLYLKPLNQGTAIVTLQVNSNGQLAETEVEVEVLEAAGDPVIATFEELALEPESHWAGDENGEDWFYGMGYQQQFKSGAFLFDNYYAPEYSYWMGYAYTNSTATGYSSLSDQYNSCVGTGNNGSDNYVVAYPDGSTWDETPSIHIDGEPQIVPGFYITNTAWVVKAITETDGMTEGAFTLGDYFKITIHALDKDGKETATRDFCLADYRFEQEADRYYISDWQYVDLSQMGEAAAFTFTFDGSRKNAWGLTTPTYFCIDDFGAEGTENIREEGIATSISTVNFEPCPTGIYNINGQRVDKADRPGVYIINGRKVIKK